MEEIIGRVSDEDGCHRPAAIAGNEINSVEIYFEELPTKEDILILKQRANNFSKDIKY